MNDDVYQIAEELKNELENDPRVIRLNELEKELNNSQEVALLVMKKDNANNDYNDILRHSKEDSEEAKKYQHILYEAKKALDEHPLVRRYNAAYKEVRELYDNISDILFSSFNASLCPKEK